MGRTRRLRGRRVAQSKFGNPGLQLRRRPLRHGNCRYRPRRRMQWSNTISDPVPTRQGHRKGLQSMAKGRPRRRGRLARKTNSPPPRALPANLSVHRPIQHTLACPPSSQPDPSSKDSLDSLDSRFPPSPSGAPEPLRSPEIATIRGCPTLNPSLSIPLAANARHATFHRSTQERLP